MSTMDSALVVFAVIDIVAIAMLAYVGAQLMETAQNGKKRLQPVMDEAGKITNEGKAVAERVSTGGKEIADRVKATVNQVKVRTNRTKHLISEIHPKALETGQTVVEGGRSALSTATTLGSMAKRVGRIAGAAQAARNAARDGSTSE
jgi:hypothetical protein